MSGTYTLPGSYPDPDHGKQRATEIVIPERCGHGNVVASCKQCEPNYVPPEDD